MDLQHHFQNLILWLIVTILQVFESSQIMTSALLQKYKRYFEFPCHQNKLLIKYPQVNLNSLMLTEKLCH
jgi:hypothetical protein